MSGCMVCVWFACECVCVHAYAYVWCTCMRVCGVSVNECACVCEFVIMYACMDMCVIHALGNNPRHTAAAVLLRFWSKQPSRYSDTASSFS